MNAHKSVMETISYFKRVGRVLGFSNLQKFAMLYDDTMPRMGVLKK